MIKKTYFGKEANVATWVQSVIKLSSKLRHFRFLKSFSITPSWDISLPPNCKSSSCGNWGANDLISCHVVNVWFNASVFKFENCNPWLGGGDNLDWLWQIDQLPRLDYHMLSLKLTYLTRRMTRLGNCDTISEMVSQLHIRFLDKSKSSIAM